MSASHNKPVLSSRLLVALIVILGLGFVAVVLVPGLQLASELADSTVAMKFVGQQQRHPATLRGSLDTLHDRLGSHGYLQESLEQLRDADAKFSSAVAVMTVPRASIWSSLPVSTGTGDEPMAGRRAALLKDLWSKEHAALAPVLAFEGVPDQDSESAGTVLNDSGKAFELDLNNAIRASRRAVPQLDAEMTAIVADLENGTGRAASRLKVVMLVGVAIALGLMGLVSVLLLSRRRQDASLRAARQQTTDILRTVKDGLFLLDADLVIGAAYSAAMEALFQRSDIAGLKFEQLLDGIVPEKTLATALKFVNVLWTERTKENLVKSINPLGEVEVSLDDGKGKPVIRYLQFDFHRVRLEGKISNVLVSVSDVTARVELSRELQNSQSQAQGQVDTLLGILSVDPAQLSSFLNDSNTSMKMINAVLREPAREEGAFRKKLDTLFRQVHAVKGEASALGLSSIEARAHSFEDDLNALRDKADLSGNDFLPLVVKLDDLLTHLQSTGELVSRLSRLHVAADASHTSTDVIPRGIVKVDKKAVQRAETGLVPLLGQLTARVAAENGKEATLECVGFELIPEAYRRVVKDISVQAVRNALVHGIEPAAERVATGKAQRGTLRLTFQESGDAGFRLVAEDDGLGLSVERIKAAAVKRGLLTAERALTLEPKQAFALLFQAGFTTLENPTKDAGRGVGMNLIAELMQQVGGKVSVATHAGKFTRLTMTMPLVNKATVAA